MIAHYTLVLEVINDARRFVINAKGRNFHHLSR